MKYCPKCGAQLRDEATFCTSCGTKQTVGEPVRPAANSDTSKLFCILAYIPLLWLVGLLVKPNSEDPDVRFHVGQGMFLNIIGMAFSIAVSVISAFLGFIFQWSLSLLILRSVVLGIVGTAGSVLYIILLIVGIMNAANRRNEELPLIGKYAFYR